MSLKQSALRWACLVVGVEILSALTIFHPLANSILTVVAALGMAYVAWKRPTIGLAALALELLIGSKGYLLQFALFSTPISLRIALTAAFMVGWFVNFLQHSSVKQLANLFRDKRAYLVLFIAIGYATLRGMMLNNMANVVGDGNAWGDWFLLFPVLDIAWRYRDRIRQDVVPVFFVGVAWLAVKTIGLEYLFSHGFTAVAPNAYLWVRRTGVGEVTLMTANAFRIFMQSYIYALPAMIVALAWWFTQKGRSKIAWWMMVASTVILGISLSRSFWIGAAAGIIGLVMLLSIKKIAWWKKLVGPITAAIAGIAIIFVVLAFPIPPVNYASLATLFGSRTNLDEAAAVSRWNLLPVLWNKIEQHPILGSGFGATVTYQSKDPRIIAQTGGTDTTYAFEWGWFEHWIKFGIIGIPLMAYLLWSLAKRLWKLNEPLWLRAAVVSSLIALAVTHFFTPYLNHPLGFLFFFVGEGMILSSYGKNGTAIRSKENA